MGSETLSISTDSAQVDQQEDLEQSDAVEPSFTSQQLASEESSPFRFNPFPNAIPPDPTEIPNISPALSLRSDQPQERRDSDSWIPPLPNELAAPRLARSG